MKFRRLPELVLTSEKLLEWQDKDKQEISNINMTEVCGSEMLADIILDIISVPKTDPNDDSTDTKTWNDIV